MMFLIFCTIFTYFHYNYNKKVNIVQVFKRDFIQIIILKQPKT